MQSLSNGTDSIAKLCLVAEEEPSIGVGLVIAACMWIPEVCKDQQSSILSLLAGVDEDARLQSHLLAAELSEDQAMQLVRLVCKPGNLPLCKQLVRQVLSKLTLVPSASSTLETVQDEPLATSWPGQRQTMVQLVKAITICLADSSYRASLSHALESQLAAALRLLMAEPELQACGAVFTSEIMNLDAGECKILQVRSRSQKFCTTISFWTLSCCHLKKYQAGLSCRCHPCQPMEHDPHVQHSNFASGLGRISYMQSHNESQSWHGQALPRHRKQALSYVTSAMGFKCI